MNCDRYVRVLATVLYYDTLLTVEHEKEAENRGYFFKMI